VSLERRVKRRKGAPLFLWTEVGDDAVEVDWAFGFRMGFGKEERKRSRPDSAQVRLTVREDKLKTVLVSKTFLFCKLHFSVLKFI
jgi:hypothetical protein